MTAAAMTVGLRVALLVGVALLALGLGGVLARRSLLGMVTAFVPGMAGVALMAVALLGQTGRNAALGHVITTVLVMTTAAVVAAALAVYLAAARAARHDGRAGPR